MKCIVVLGDYKVGDLVRIKQGTHAAGMSESRIGLVVELRSTGIVKNGKSQYLYMVRFGESVLQFHPMWLERVY
jgi:hypothetical protein